MGGDGGTLNNSRADHVRMRAALGGSAAAADAKAGRARARASVTECAVSRAPLAAPVVADRLGQLCNKEALIGVLLARSGFAHVRRLGRDTVAVAEWRVCGVTREAVTEEGRFVLGWECGCVVAGRAVDAVRGKGWEAAGAAGECVACGVRTELVRLGMTGEERDGVLVALEEAGAGRKKTGKRKRGEDRPLS